MLMEYLKRKKELAKQLERDMKKFKKSKSTKWILRNLLHISNRFDFPLLLNLLWILVSISDIEKDIFIVYFCL